MASCRDMTAPATTSSRLPAECIALAEEIAGPEWAEWYLLSPIQRWEASQRLWTDYVNLGGSLDPEVDLQSPFWTAGDYADFAAGRL